MQERMHSEIVLVTLEHENTERLLKDAMAKNNDLEGLKSQISCIVRHLQASPYVLQLCYHTVSVDACQCQLTHFSTTGKTVERSILWPSCWQGRNRAHLAAAEQQRRVAYAANGARQRACRIERCHN